MPDDRYGMHAFWERVDRDEVDNAEHWRRVRAANLRWLADDHHWNAQAREWQKREAMHRAGVKRNGLRVVR